MEQTERTWYTAAFADRIDVGAYVPTTTHERALDAVRSWLKDRSAVMLLVGEPGVGKTMLSQWILARLASPERSALVTARPGAPSIISLLARSLGPLSSSSSGTDTGKNDVSESLISRVRQRLRRYREFLLIVDQAEHLDVERDGHLDALLGMRSASRSVVRLLLMGRPEAQAKFHPPSPLLHTMPGRVTSLGPMNLEDTITYVRHRLKWAGADESDVRFDDVACARVYAFTGGNPRLIHRLCAATVQRVLQGGDTQVTGEVLAYVWETIMATRSSDAERQEAVLIESAAPRNHIEAAPPTVASPICVEKNTFQVPCAAADPVDGQTVSMNDAARKTMSQPTPSSVMMADDDGAADFSPVSENHVEHLIANGEALLAKLEASLKATSPDADGGNTRMYDTAGELEMNAVVRRAEQLLDRLDTATRRASKRIAQTRQKAARAAVVYQKSARLMAARVENADSLSRQIASQIQKLEELGREHRETERRLTALAERLEQAGQNARQEADTCGRDLAGAERRALSVIEQIEAVGARISAAESRFEDVLRQAQSQRIEHARLIEQLGEQTAQLEHLKATLGGMGGSLTLLCDKAASRAAELNGIMDESRSRNEDIRRNLLAFEQKLSDCRIELDRTFAPFRGVEKQLGEQRTRLEELIRAAGQVTCALRDVLDEGRKFQGSIAATADEWRAREQTLNDWMAKINAACQRAESAKQAVEELNAPLRQAEATRQQTLDAVRQIEQSAWLADQKCGALASHVASASQAIGELNDGNIEARRAIMEIEQTRRQAAETLGALTGQMNDLRRDIAAAEASSQTLNHQREQAEPVLGNLNAALGQAREWADTLGNHNAQACQNAETLRAGAAGAAKLIERLTAVSQSLQSAQSLHAGLTAVVQQASAEHQATLEVIKEAQTCIDCLRKERNDAQTLLGEHRLFQEQSASTAQRLNEATTRASETAADLNAVAERCQDRLTQLREDMQRAELLVGRADVLLQRIDDAEGAVQAGDKMIREFLTQAQALTATLKELHVKTSDVERQVQELSREPQALVQDARRQTEQLDKVCRAVQKVFAGLSKISLEANQRIEQLKALDQQTGDRLVRWTTETEAAAKTLREWVEEAIRAQARLAATLAKTPSIVETHATHALHALARSLQVEPATVAASSVRASPMDRSAPQSDRMTPVSPLTADAASPVRQKTRTQQINELIQEAQRRDAVSRPTAGAGR